MARRRPLVMNGGVIERLQVGDLLTLGKLNLGLIQPLPVVAGSVTVTQSLHRIVNNDGGTVNFTTINGGEEGDILILLGPSTNAARLEAGGNYDGLNCLFNDHKDVVVLTFTGSIWILVTRNL